MTGEPPGSAEGDAAFPQEDVFDEDTPDVEPVGEDEFDEGVFGRGANRTPLVAAIVVVLLVVGLAGVALLTIMVFGVGGEQAQEARTPAGELVMSVPHTWLSTSEAVPGEAAGSTIYRLDAAAPEGTGHAVVTVVVPASDDPISALPQALAELLATVPGCTFGEPERVRDEAERAALVAHGECPSGPAAALAGGTYTEASREAWTIFVEGGSADPHEILDSVEILGHDGTGAPL